jgi:hypothetical protein
MREQPGSVPQPDMGLDHAREMVARILEFIASNEERLKRFLQLPDFRPKAFRETARSPLSMLSILGFIVKDEQLLRELAENEKIEIALIELARARLSFEVAAKEFKAVDPVTDPSVARERFFQELHVILKQVRER